jgi:dipeptidyl aminopeptidase/acylaminoacyl peptidase
MKYYFLLTLVFAVVVGHAQKPALDTGSFKNWEFVGGGAISNDGNYISYFKNSLSKGEHQFVIRSSTGMWKMEFSGVSQAKFTYDNSYIVFEKGMDSLGILALGKDQCVWIEHISDFYLEDDHRSWLVYRLKAKNDDLFLRNLNSGDERQFLSVNWYAFSDSGRNITIGRQVMQNNSPGFVVEQTKLFSNTMARIWFGLKAEREIASWTVSGINSGCAFIVNNKTDSLLGNELWYFMDGTDSACKLADSHSPGIGSELRLDDQRLEFSKDARFIYFALKQKKIRERKSGAVQIDVWSYLDKTIQPVQIAESGVAANYEAIIDIANKRIIRLEQSDERIIDKNAEYVLIKHGPGIYSEFESYWNRSARLSYFLISIIDGSRRLIRDNVISIAETVGMSPRGKWLLYYDYTQKNYFSYEISTGILRNVTKGVSSYWTDRENDMLDYKLTWVPWKGTWLKDDEFVLIYDNYDIWEVDPRGVKRPVNITNRYGQIHHIKFEIAEEDGDVQKKSIQKNSNLLLSAINTVTMDRGFYLKSLADSQSPELRMMGRYVFGEWIGHGSYNFPPTKAKDANIYLFKRMSITEAPNYFLTVDDFKHLIPITNFHPQLSYNWMTSNLIQWKNKQGITVKAILYKPENFDPKNKYPVIFDYYETRTEELNLFIWPKTAQSRINIGWYVSNGYLVCVPDIHYTQGEPGKSACDIVVFAARQLARMPWVNGKKMGIQGHSFGGYETNYIVTHTGLFAAACAASAVCDLISWDGSVTQIGYPKYSSERGQVRMGGTLWDIPKNYIRNSPIFYADKVKTPLLIMNNKADQIVPFEQGVEFFMALRRLGKKVWMLQYDEGGHSLDPGKDAMDYSVRMLQFFNHYLKQAPAPLWMTKGIAARMKGIDDGLRFDPDMLTPGNGLNDSKTFKAQQR